MEKKEIPEENRAEANMHIGKTQETPVKGYHLQVINLITVTVVKRNRLTTYTTSKSFECIFSIKV